MYNKAFKNLSVFVPIEKAHASFIFQGENGLAIIYFLEFSLLNGEVICSCNKS